MQANKDKQRVRLSSIRKQARNNSKRKRSEASNIQDQQTTEAKENKENDNFEDNEIVLKEYFSDNEHQISDSENENTEELEVEEQDIGTKIFYCSRTHSQLNQFVHELQKTKYVNTIQVVSLASRQSYCINEDVQRLKSTSKINDKCLDMQKKGKEKKSVESKTQKRRKIESLTTCPYYNHMRLREFKEHVAVEVQDIEQLVSLGRDLETCPYYGSRFSISQSQLVVLPYQMLLHKPARESLGINLQGNIIIIDEAHNLIETINNIHSVEVQQKQIISSKNELQRYIDRYRQRLKAKNLFYIEQILHVLECLHDILSQTNSNKAEMLTINNFIYKSKIDNVNLFKIRKFCEKSMISKKLNGFIDKYEGKMSNMTSSSSSQFYSIEAFFESLTNADKDGRVLITKEEKISDSKIKFLLLNPSVHFEEILRECRSVIVAGGTMQPVAEFKDLLLHAAKISEEKILEFSCGHVIPPSNLLAISLDTGPSSTKLNFTYQNRTNSELIEELGRLLMNICTVVPGGVVCFFPSYGYEELIYKTWNASGVLDRMQTRKKVFREPKNTGSCEKVLQDYAACIKNSKAGAILFSVVGGKISEGINFSDNLGRCIVMVGLPYPNLYSAELQEKMAYLNKTIGPSAGQEHYENICMKAVNQSIGRAIRHKNDYAIILLLDHRYANEKVVGKLPDWIREKLKHYPKFGPGLGAISKFFASKKPFSNNN